MSLDTTIPVNAAMHEAESRSLWRAVYAATVAHTSQSIRDIEAARWAANTAVSQYAKRFPAKLREENPPSAST